MLSRDARGPEKKDALGAARRHVVRLLAKRAMTRAGVIASVRRRGLGEDDAARVAAELEKRGLIDDRAYAAAYVRGLLARKPAGRALLMAKLRQRGIEGTVARAAVESALKERDAGEDALELATRRLRVIGSTVDRAAAARRVYGLLARRGFEAEVCGEAVRKAMKGWEGGYC